AQAPVRAADEGDQRRCIYRTHVARTWQPAPAAADIHPAARVRRCETPRCVVHPGPAAGRDPAPVAVAVRRPAGGDAAREPDMAVVADMTPAAVVVEVGIADQLAGDVLPRRRAQIAVVAGERPAVEVVGRR